MNKILTFLASLLVLFLITSCATKEIQPQPRPVKVALVLGAGAARGFAHIGVLKVLETNKIPIHMIIGTSAGSFIGALYSYGYDAFELQKLSFNNRQDDIVDFTIPDNGFIKGGKLADYINHMLRNTPMEKLRIPFYAVTTDIRNGKEMVFGRGDTGTAVRASCSIPGIFKPVPIGGRLYVDGGVVSPVAVEAARRLGADIVIAVDISGNTDLPAPANTIDTILQSISIMYSRLSAIQLAKADVVIRPKLGCIGSTDFLVRNEAILEGEKAATEALPRIKAIVNGVR